jgi:predicted O-linked N-acetylglucosamine transferase (SPINDLY family)
VNISDLENILKEDSSNIVAIELLALLYLQNNQEEKFHSLLSKKTINSHTDDFYFNIGLIFLSKSEYEKSILYLNKVSQNNPKAFEVLVNIGLALASLNKLNDALTYFDRAMLLNEHSEELYYNIGLIHDKKNDPVEAIHFYEKAIAINPDFVEAWINLGVCNFERFEFNKSIECYSQAKKINPQVIDIWINEAFVYKAMLRRDLAIASLENALAINPQSLDAMTLVADIALESANYSLASSFYKKIILCNTKQPFIHGLLMHCNMMQCNWDGYFENRQFIEDGVLRGESVTPPFPFIAFTNNPQLQLKSSKIWAESKYSKDRSHLKVNGVRKKIKIAYFSSDFYSHATTSLLGDVLKNHDKKIFDIYLFDFSIVSDETSSELERYSTQVFKINNKNDGFVINLSRDLELDIAVDLKGYTQFSRPQIFACGIAPIQINFLGYPGTMGCSFIDYIIADQFLIPPGMTAFYGEKVIYLPDCYQPNNEISLDLEVTAAGFDRAYFGLPKDSFIFASFNSSYKITPEVFDSWIRILKNTENTILLILVNTSKAEANLRNYAVSKGFDYPERLLFCRPIKKNLHLSRLNCVDLHLDTFPCNGHTTTSDALRAGLPVITISGNTFASRVSGSLLSCLGLHELIANDLSHYEEKAIALASNKDDYDLLKQKLTHCLINSNLFAPKVYAKNLETIFSSLVNKSH